MANDGRQLSPPGGIVMFTDSERINTFSERFCGKYRNGTIELRVWLAYQDFVKSRRRKFVKPVHATKGEWKQQGPTPRTEDR